MSEYQSLVLLPTYLKVKGVIHAYWEFILEFKSQEEVNSFGVMN